MDKVDILRVPTSESLDEITVYWHNYEPGRGMVTVVCWGSAWNCYFGGMSGQTIQEFFYRVETDYLVNKLGCTQWLKSTKHHEKYLVRLIDGVKAAMKENAPHQS